MNTLTKEQLASIKEEFKRYDKNKDGKLTVDEFSGVVGKYLTPEALSELIKKLDPNDDKEITLEECIDGYNADRR